MTLYNVHIYREMRLFFPGIEAATLQGFEAAWCRWAEDIRRSPRFAATCELLRIYEAAHAAIAKATARNDEPAEPRRTPRPSRATPRRRS